MKNSKVSHQWGIYLYESIKEGSYSFNVIFRRNGEADLFSGMIPDENIINQMLTLGLDDLESLSRICARYRRECSTQIRGHRGLHGILQLGRNIRMLSAPPSANLNREHARFVNSLLCESTAEPLAKVLFNAHDGIAAISICNTNKAKD